MATVSMWPASHHPRHKLGMYAAAAVNANNLRNRWLFMPMSDWRVELPTDLENSSSREQCSSRHLSLIRVVRTSLASRARGVTYTRTCARTVASAAWTRRANARATGTQSLNTTITIRPPPGSPIREYFLKSTHESVTRAAAHPAESRLHVLHVAGDLAWVLNIHQPRCGF